MRLIQLHKQLSVEPRTCLDAWRWATPKEETRRIFQDALAAHFEAVSEVGEPIPEPHSSVDYVEVGDVAATPIRYLDRCNSAEGPEHHEFERFAEP